MWIYELSQNIEQTNKALFYYSIQAPIPPQDACNGPH